MNKRLDIRFILIASGVGALLLLVGLGGRAYYLRATGLKQARVHAEAAFQGQEVKTSISCVGFWERQLPSGNAFKVYTETSNGWGIEPADFTYVAVNTSDGRRYERIGRFHYAEARAFGDPANKLMPSWEEAKSDEEKAAAVQDRAWAWSNHPRVARILQLRLVNSLDELDTVLTDLGFTKN